MYIYGWVALLWTWNYDNIVYQLYSNAKLKVKKRKERKTSHHKRKKQKEKERNIEEIQSENKV